MVRKLKKHSHAGFTIIEVMIVLAIAALILLIVLLAIPALQRNSRNNSIKNDASIIAGAISTSVSDNDGRMPTWVLTFGGNGKVWVVNTETENFNVQESTKVSSTTTSGPMGSGSTYVDPDLGNIKVYLGYRCDNQKSYKSAAILYDVETSGSPKTVCLEV